MKPIQSIEIELANCIAAWEAAPDATWAWCCHHTIHVEPLTEPWRNRVDYILSYKPERERARRFRNFRPLRAELPKAYVEARKAYVEARKACVEAGKAYDEARMAYDEAGKAHDEARKAYDEAGRAYDEAGKAYDEAGRAYETELQAVHTADWPDHTWIGKSIF